MIVLQKKMFGVSTYPAYHSLQDTFNYVKRFVDPLFSTHLATAKIWLTSVYLLAESPIIPFGIEEYVQVINSSAVKLKQKYGKKLENQSISLGKLIYFQNIILVTFFFNLLFLISSFIPSFLSPILPSFP